MPVIIIVVTFGDFLQRYKFTRGKRRRNMYFVFRILKIIRINLNISLQPIINNNNIIMLEWMF